jgi:hypothetical protein
MRYLRFQRAQQRRRGVESAELEFMHHCYPIKVNEKDCVGRPDIDAFFRMSGTVIVALTVRETLNEQLAKKAGVSAIQG